MFEKYNTIYVYGYNNWGRNVYNKIKALYPSKTVAIIVKRMNKNTKGVSKTKNILALEEVNVKENAVVIIGVSPLSRDSIIENLSHCGFSDIVTYNHKIDDYINDKLDDLPKLEVKLVSICVGQACNLKCRDCANFAPYAHKNNMRYPIEKIKRDIDRALPYFSMIDILHIQGGEPFIYSDLPELLKYIKERYGHLIKKIRIATNGTIVPSEETLDAMKEAGAVVRISNYPIETKGESIGEVLETKGIGYTLYNFVNTVGEWSNTGDLEYVIDKNVDVVKQVFQCGWNWCYTIENGLIGRCARSIPALSLQGIRQREMDYIDLNKEIDIKKFHKYFIFTSPMECCRHCKGSTGEPIEPAIQIK